MNHGIVTRIARQLAIAGLVASGASAQRASPAEIAVQVRDSIAVVSGADVSVVLGVNNARATGVTDDRGRVTLRLSSPAPNADYQLVVRKIGYERADRFFRVTRDSLSFDIPLRRVAQELAPVVVTAEQDLKRKSYHVGEDDIASSTEVLLDATDILAKMRPDMICGRSCSPTATTAAITRNPVRKCPTLTFMRPQRATCPTTDEPPSYATNVWVNGRRIRLAIPDAMAVARQHGVLAGLSQASMTVLSQIKPEHIAEMTYVDEWDTTIDKLGAQGGLFVVLKPGVAYEPGRESYVLPSDPSPAKEAAAPAQLPDYRLRLLGVYDRDTGDPIEGAWVIDMTTGTKARTTSTGTVSLAFLPEGGTPLRITKDGYDDLSIAVEISSEHKDPLTLVMVRQAKPPAP
jgi:hypothetical protein